MNFICHGDRILVSVIEEKRYIDGFVLPDLAKQDFLQGLVVAVGNGRMKDNGERVPLDIKPGMRVVFGPYAGTPVFIKGEKYLNMRDGEIVGWFEGE